MAHVTALNREAQTLAVICNIDLVSLQTLSFQGFFYHLQPRVFKLFFFLFSGFLQTTDGRGTRAGASGRNQILLVHAAGLSRRKRRRLLRLRLQRRQFLERFLLLLVWTATASKDSWRTATAGGGMQIPTGENNTTYVLDTRRTLFKAPNF